MAAGARPVAVVLILLIGLLPGCSPATAEPLANDLPALAGSLTATIAEADRAGFLENFAGTPQARMLGDMWFTNLVQFEDVVAEPDPAGAQDALVVSWRVPGDSVVARGGLALELTTGQDRTLITGRNRQERPPLWSLETLAVIGTSTGSLLVGQESAGDVPRWRSRLDSVVGSLARADLGPLTREWDGRVVIGLPSQPTTFALATGLSASATAAATLYEGDAVRIVVNPLATQELSQDSLGALLHHEAVHAAVGTPRFPNAPRWLVEGLAEWVTADSDPGTAAANRALVRDRLAASGLPSALPEDADLTSDGPDALTCYALSQIAVEAVVDRAGRERGLEFVNSVLRDPDGAWPIERAEVTQWYREALAGVE